MKCKCCGKEVILVPKTWKGKVVGICHEDEKKIVCIGDEEE